VLYESLCGRPPFTGKVAEVLEKIRSEEPPAPSRLRPDVDARLEAICLRAMAKAPRDRFASAGQMAAALGRYLHTLPAPMPGLDASADDAQARRRRRLLGWTFAAAALVLIAILSFLGLGGGRAVIEVARSWSPREFDTPAAPPLAGSAAPLPAPHEPISRDVPELVAEAERPVESAPKVARPVLMESAATRTRELTTAPVEMPLLLQAEVRQARPSAPPAPEPLRRMLGERRRRRAERWVILFNRSSADAYLNQLGALGGEVAFPQSGEHCVYFSDLAQGRTSSERNLAQEERIFLIEASPELVQETARALEAPPAAYFLTFLPPPLEEQLLKLELSRHSRQEEEIVQTIFDVVPQGSGCAVVVKEQISRER
jgi:hypothetical protein